LLTIGVRALVHRYYDDSGDEPKCSACGAGEDVAEDGRSCKLTAALIILIVVVLVLVAVLVLAGIIALILKSKAAREKAQAEAANAPALHWDQAEEMQVY
jgi:flagellar basal body-associated protein FliL